MRHIEGWSGGAGKTIRGGEQRGRAAPTRCCESAHNLGRAGRSFRAARDSVIGCCGAGEVPPR
eukprot:7431097-Pyramimonas_sp.AAC.2